MFTVVKGQSTHSLNWTHSNAHRWNEIGRTPSSKTLPSRMGYIWSYARRCWRNEQYTLPQVYNARRSVWFLDDWNNGGSCYAMLVRCRYTKSNRKRRGEDNRKFTYESWKPMDGIVSLEKGCCTSAWQQVASNQKARSNWASTDEKPWIGPGVRPADGGDERNGISQKLSDLKALFTKFPIMQY